MRILGTSDIHIHNYTAYSKLDSSGVPDRLSAFESLAQDTVKLAKDRKCDVIVVAGDISHAAVTRPMVQYYIRRYIEILCKSKLPIIMTIGQHDMDVKAQVTNPVHSVISSIVPTYKNLHYCNDATELTIKGTKFYVHPWTKRTVPVVEADVFVGHGLVVGASDPHGYKFMSGFDPDSLCDNYKLSIIGDIHNGHTFKKNKSAVLIPGSPIQTNWKDSPNCGLWVVDVDEDCTFEFVSIYSLRDDGTYHRFLYADDESSINPDLPSTHYWIKDTSKKTNRKTKNNTDEVAVNSDVLSVFDIANQCLLEEKVDNIDLYKRTLEKCYTTAQSATTYTPVTQELISLKISNFLSIKEFELPTLENEVLIVGPNGAGKSSLAESIYWLLTGNLTKPLSVANIGNHNTKQPPRVEGIIAIGDTKYKIVRGRNNGPYLFFSIVPDAGDEIQLDKSSVKETQALIYEILGLDESEILTLAYYSTRQLSIFSELSSVSKMNLIGKLSNIDQLTEFRESASNYATDLNNQCNVYQGKIEAIQENINRHKNTIEYAKKCLEQKDTKALDLLAIKVLGTNHDKDYKKVRKEATALKQKYRSEYDKSAISEVDRLNLSQMELQNTKTRTESEGKRLRQSADTLKSRHKKATEGTCPTCNAPLQNESVLEAINSELTTTTSKLTQLRSRYVEVEKQLKTTEIELSEYQEAIKKNKEIDSQCDTIDSLIVELDDFDSDREYIDIPHVQKLLAEDESSLKNLESMTIDLYKEYEAATWIHRKFLSKNGPVAIQITQASCQMLENEINRVAGVTGIVTAEVVGGKDIDVKISFNGKRPVLLDGMSGGERRVVDILIMIALSNLFTKKYGLVSGVLGMSIFDEVFSYLDDQYTELGYLALSEGLNTKTKVVITHSEALMPYFNKIIKVQADEQGNSVYEISES